jgi:hypothetical protein
MRQIRLLVVCGFDPASTFSYHTAWPKHLAAHPRFACTTINLRDQRAWTKIRALALIRAARFDAIVLLHSVFSNARLLDGRLSEAVREAKRPKVYFIGNEYKLMPGKMAFCEEMEVSLLVSQSSSPEVHRLYRERLGCAVAGLPNTGFDPALFASSPPRSERPIDIGYRADDAPWYIGHRERREIAEYFQDAAARYGLSVDISLDPSARFGEREWAGFLGRCKGQLGTEAGGDYFELDDHTREAVIAYTTRHPKVGFDEVHERFFRDYGPSVPIRIMSGRQVEAAGARTVQILLDGRYDGYFEPDVHYIPLRKDFSNADEAIRKFRDEAFCRALADRAYALVSRELTYTALIDRFAGHLEAVLSR